LVQVIGLALLLQKERVYLTRPLLPSGHF
jgi:hypothetical protein